MLPSVLKGGTHSRQGPGWPERQGPRPIRLQGTVAGRQGRLGGGTVCSQLKEVSNDEEEQGQG